MAGLPAKRNRFHVRDRAVSQLAGDHDVRERGDAHERQQPPEFQVLQVQAAESWPDTTHAAVSLLFRQ